jgi:ParB family chromosome partitioning protein
MGHARALLSLPTEKEQLAALARILAEQLSVRDVEALSKPEATKKAAPASTSAKTKPSLSTTEKLYLSYLTEQLGTKVSIDKTPEGKGKLIVHFDHEADLQRLIEMLKKSK